MAGVKDQLREMLRVDGVKTAVIVSRDGLVIDAVARESGTDVDGIGAVLTNGLVATNTKGNDLAVGNLSQSIEEFDNGVLVVSSLGDYSVLCLVCDQGVNLGMVRFQIRKAAPLLSRGM